MDPIWIAGAFVFGFGVRLIGLPPLIGFLIAGFVLDATGKWPDALDDLEAWADFGIHLLLFSIGLKLNLKSLLRPEIWGVATGHMAITVIIFGLALFGLSLTGASVFGDLNFGTAVLVAFALSFSSTVFAVKALEDSGEMASLHGRVAIGILIVQDIIAIVFMTVSTGKYPSAWALLLLGLPLVRPVLMWIMTKSGHGELLVLMGLLFVIGGTSLFSAVGLKADLGAIIFGVLVGQHPKASEMSKALFGFKDLFLVAFFLSIGFYGNPTLQLVGIAAAVVVVMPLKVALFYYLMTRFKLRARTSTLGSLSLANYSEFGLIVAAVGGKNGWISADWLCVIAIALSITFVIAAPLNARGNPIYTRYRARLLRFQRARRLPDDQMIDLGGAEILVVGMGRVGAGAFDALLEKLGPVVVGVDSDPAKVEIHKEAERNVVLGDPTDTDAYERTIGNQQVRVVLLTMSNHNQNLAVIRHLKHQNPEVRIGAVAAYRDEAEELTQAGATAFNIYAETGLGFADHVCKQLGLGPDEERGPS